MLYIPHEKLSLQWSADNQSLALSLPWVSMDIDIEEADKGWVQDAIDHLHISPSNQNVQKLIHNLKDYPVFYIQPRQIEAFEELDLQLPPPIVVDTSTPTRLIGTFECPLSEEMKSDMIPTWTWDWEAILSKARIPGTDLYDPLSLISYLICYRLEWENTTWSGQDGFGKALISLVQENETKFFQAIGWVAKQSWYVTKTFHTAATPALVHFNKAHELIHHFMCDEVGHYKFMEQVFDDLNLNRDDFPIESQTRWTLSAFKKAAASSPLLFSAMINLFEAAYYEGQDPISRAIRLSSKPHAAQGYDLHYKINQEHRHCDMPLHLAAYLAPQTYDHATLTLGIFELTLNFLDRLEERRMKA